MMRISLFWWGINTCLAVLCICCYFFENPREFFQSKVFLLSVTGKSITIERLRIRGEHFSFHKRIKIKSAHQSDTRLHNFAIKTNFATCSWLCFVLVAQMRFCSQCLPLFITGTINSTSNHLIHKMEMKQSLVVLIQCTGYAPLVQLYYASNRQRRKLIDEIQKLRRRFDCI